MLRHKGFLPYAFILFCSAFVDLGQKYLLLTSIHQSSGLSHYSMLEYCFIALVLLPYFFLFTPSGFLADKFSKTKILRLTAISSVALTLLLTWCYSHGFFSLAFFFSILLAIQTALNSPAKYGYIKELFSKGYLARANAVAQVITAAAIFIAICILSWLTNHNIDQLGEPASKAAVLQAIVPACYLLILLAIIEASCTYLLPQQAAAAPDSQYKIKNALKAHYFRQYLKLICDNQVIKLSMLGLAIFWGVSAVLLASFSHHIDGTITHADAEFFVVTFATLVLGVLAGASYAGRISRGFIETGLIPISAVATFICSLLLSASHSHFFIVCLLFIYGIFGGMITVALNALIQFNAPEEDLGKIMAANNFVRSAAIISLLIVGLIYFSVSAHQALLIVVLGLLTATYAAYAVISLPQSLIRYILYFAFSKFYRLSVNGLDNIPSSGAALLLGNHISFFDWAILQVASPRPIRFVMPVKHQDKWYFRWILQKMRVIPFTLDNTEQAINDVKQALLNGDVVALFPEGRLCRNGQLGQFNSDFEEAVNGTGAPIIPFYLLGLWGTATTYATAHYKRLSRARTRPISVSFGEALADTTNTEQVKKQVVELSIIAWKLFVASLGTIPDVWLDRVKQIPNAPCLIDTIGLKLTNIQLFSTVLYLRKQLRNRIYNRSQNIGILLPAGAPGIIANLAVLMLGKTVVNINYTTSEKNILSMLKAANIKTIITAKPFLSRLEAKGYNLGKIMTKATPIYIEELKSPIRKLIIIRNIIFVTLTPLSILRKILIKKQDSLTTAAIMFSSGSESKPKGVELTHRNIVGNAKQSSDVFNMEDNDKMLTVLPLFHAFGFTVTTIMPLIEGTPMICHPDPTDVIKIAKLIHEHQITIMCATSTFLGMYCRNKKVLPDTLASLRLVIAGAEKLSEKVRDDFRAKFKLEIFEGYGTTEVAPVASTNLPDATGDDDWQVQVSQRVGTVGLPLPGTAFKIVDPDTHEELPTGTEGMILIGGTQVMKGYLNDAKKTAEVLIPDQEFTWYITGDKGHLDEEGFLTIVDRYSRFAKIGGEMVSLSAVEQRIEKLINDNAIEIMAVAIPDLKKGEKIVLLHTGKLESKWIREKLLSEAGSNLMLPSVYLALDDLPKLGSGKKDFASGKKLALEIN